MVVENTKKTLVFLFFYNEEIAGKKKAVGRKEICCRHCFYFDVINYVVKKIVVVPYLSAIGH